MKNLIKYRIVDFVAFLCFTLFVFSKLAQYNLGLKQKFKSSYFYTNLFVSGITINFFLIWFDGHKMKRFSLALVVERNRKRKLACTPSGGYHAQEHTEL